MVTDDFTKFENTSQLCSYVDITPTIGESGSSLKGRARISKVGNKKLRTLVPLMIVSTTKLVEHFVNSS